MRIINYLLIFIILSTTVIASDRALEWTNDYCNTDFNCFEDAICITQYTTNEIYGLSSKSDANVFEAQRYGKEGMCAKMFTDTGDIRIYYTNYVGTQDIPNIVVEEVTCPACIVCENETDIEYVNVSVPTPYEVEIIKTNWYSIIVVTILFVGLMIGGFFYIRKKMNKNFYKKYGKRIVQLDALDDQFKGITDKIIKTNDIKNKNVVIKKKTLDYNIKTLSDKELNFFK